MLLHVARSSAARLHAAGRAFKSGSFANESATWDTPASLAMRRKVILFLASGAYLGYAPLAPGTVGTFYGVALYPVFDALRLRSAGLYVLTFIALVAAAVWIAGQAEAIWGQHDCGRITIDEAAGYIATTLFLPLSLVTAVGGFLAFRLFDILKPWPAGYFDRDVEGGTGVVLDDVFAGIYANLVLRATFWVFDVTP
jgi:phosphatidylglycerophosphatase A